MKRRALLVGAVVILVAAGCGGSHPNHDAAGSGTIGPGTTPPTSGTVATTVPVPSTTTEAVGGVTLPVPAGWVAEPPPADDGSGDHTDYLFGTSDDPAAQLIVTSDRCTVCAQHAATSLVPSGGAHASARDRSHATFSASVPADALSTYWKGSSAQQPGYETTGVVVIGAAGGTPAYAVVAVTLPTSQRALAAQVLNGVAISSAPTASTTAPATAAACPTGAALFAAFSASPGMYTAPPGTVTGFSDVACWSGYVVATTVVADPAQDQVEPVAFATAGGLHTLTQSESAAFTSAVCSAGSAAPADWASGVVTCPS